MMGRGMGRQEDQRLDGVGSGDRRRLSLLVASSGSAGGCIQLPSGRSSQRVPSVSFVAGGLAVRI